MRVFVVEGPDKGYLGEIRDTSGSDGKFLVSLALMTAQPPRQYTRRQLAAA